MRPPPLGRRNGLTRAYSSYPGHQADGAAIPDTSQQSFARLGYGGRPAV